MTTINPNKDGQPFVWAELLKESAVHEKLDRILDHFEREQSPTDPVGEKIEHEWVVRDILPNSQICGKCGVVRRADDRNLPCRGIMRKVSLRGESPVIGTTDPVSEKIERLLDAGFSLIVERSSERQDKKPYNVCASLGLGMKQNTYSGATLDEALAKVAK